MSDVGIADLRKVDFFAGLDDTTLEEILGMARPRRYADGATLVSELESGADVFLVTRGEAEVSVEARSGERRALGVLGPGSAFGEMSSLTGELRSATVVAKGAVEVLVLADADFDRLRERRPEIAVVLVRTLAGRLGEAERSIDALFSEGAAAVAKVTTGARAASGLEVERAATKVTKRRRGSIGRVWRELVVGRQRDLGFLTLAAFVLTLLMVRVGVYVSFRFELAPRDVLRAAYMTGFSLVIGSGLASLLTFRPGVRRAIAVAYGVGMALILNELGVTLAFDIYFKDIHTADPTHPFDVEHLYRRAEPMRAIAIGLVVLIQAAYLRRFYVRAWFVLMTRLRSWFSRATR